MNTPIRTVNLALTTLKGTRLRNHLPIYLSTAVLTLALTCGLATAGGAAPMYHATLLGDMIEELFPGVTYPSSDPQRLNENGDVVGEAKINDIGHQRGWIYTVEHGVVSLPVLPGHTRGFVRDISDRDANGDVTIVGSSTYVVDPETAVLWRYSTVTGEVLETRSIGTPPGYDHSIAIAVNNNGTVVGFSSYIGPFTNWKYDVATDVVETFDFPWRVTDLNNVGQVCGGSYRGDLFGNYEDLTDVYQEGDVMPAWAIENGGISAGWHRINDQGWLVGRAATGISDGAGHYLVAIVRYADPIGWTGMPPVSHLSGAGGINDLGDFTNRTGAAYFEDMSQMVYFAFLMSPDFPHVEVYRTADINANRQVLGNQAHVFLLTPLGEMIIPGDINGDVSVDLDDHCAWVAAPIDLDGDDDVDADDEQWLIDRLLVFGFTVDDCNRNGVGDHCDIVDGVSLDCDLNDVPDECQDDCNGDGVPDVCEPDCNDNGVPDPCDVSNGTSEDCNANGIPDECDGGGVTEVAVVHDPPIRMLVSDVLVDEKLVVDAGIVEDVNLTLYVRYRLGDFTVRLSHNDTTITIMDRPGFPEYNFGFVNFGYENAIVDDEGTGPFLENAGDYCCTFESLVSPPIYRPDFPLSAFDGMPVEGVWSLQIITTDHDSPGEGLFGWGLTITRAAVEVPPCEPADIDGDGVVGFSDLLMVLSAWGSNPDHPADLDGDGQVGFSDLLMVLSAWSS